MADCQSNRLRSIVERFVTQLATETDAAKNSAPLLAYLKAAAQFHDYSLHNTILIFSQMPTATRIAGFHAWRKMGRFVKRGERGIMILAPVVPRRHEDEPNEESEPETAIRFRSVYVFDQSQTEGLALPEPPVLTGVDCADDLALSLVMFADERGIKVRSEKIQGSACGLSRGGEIIVDESLSGADYFAVLAHEVAHELLDHRAHRDELDKKTREIEAETAAYTICQHFNIPCTAPAYLALYGADAKEITARLESIVGTVQSIIAGIEVDLPVINTNVANS